MTQTVAIFGSCVTRDAFELRTQRKDAPEVKVSLYLSRTSINSCLAPPVAGLGLPPAEGKLKFEERSVRTDLDKTHFDQLRDATFDWLVIDLIDERHWLAEPAGSALCYSVPFWRLCEAHGVDHNAIPRLSPNDPALVQRTVDNIPRFLNRVLATVAQQRIVLHEAYWARQYVTHDGAVRDFEQQHMIRLANQGLQRFYARIKECCPAIATIRIPADETLADEAHRWSLDPFHYREAYYAEFLRQYDAIVAAATPARANVA